MRSRERERERVTYEKLFFRKLAKGQFVGSVKGFPLTRGAWCKKLKLWAMSDSLREDDLRENVLPYPEETKNLDGAIQRQSIYRIPRSQNPLVQQSTQNEVFTGSQYQSIAGTGAHNSSSEFSQSPIAQGAEKNIVQYLGIAADEPERIKRHTKAGVILPLVDIGWDEEYCRNWCEENDLLSPIYTTATRGGCWFCHNQGVDQLRLLRKNYPDLWALLLKWDNDSPTTFKSDGHTVHDFDKRFQMEDEGKLVPGDRKFRWKAVMENS